MSITNDQTYLTFIVFQAGNVNVSSNSTKKDEKSSDKSASKESVEKTTKEEEEVILFGPFLRNFN